MIVEFENGVEENVCTMALDPELIKILACPDCRGEIEYLTKTEKTKRGSKRGADHPLLHQGAGLRSGSTQLVESLRCRKCKRVFEVKEGIPIMLPKEEK